MRLQSVRAISVLVIVVCLCVATVGVAADDGFSVKLENSVDVPSQSVQGIDVDQVAVVEPEETIDGHATAPSNESSTVAFVTRNQSLVWNDAPVEGTHPVSIPTDDVAAGTHVVGVATGLSEDNIEAAQPVVIRAYSITMSSNDGFETTADSELHVSATLSEHEVVNEPIDTVEAVVWNETETTRVSMDQRDELEYHTNISDLDAGEYDLHIVVQSQTENDLVERNDVIGLSDSQPVTVAPQPAQPEEPDDDQEDPVTDDESPGFGITVAVISIVLVVAMTSSRVVDR